MRANAREVEVHTVADDSWSETTMTWNTHPAYDPPSLGRIGPAAQQFHCAGDARKFCLTARMGVGIALDQAARGEDLDGDWDDEYEPRGQGNDDFAFLSDMLGPGGLDALQNDDDLALEDDEDLKSDPVYSMDLKSWLSQYLQHLAQTAGRSSFGSHLSPHLNAEEASMLNSILS